MIDRDKAIDRTVEILSGGGILEASHVRKLSQTIVDTLLELSDPLHDRCPHERDPYFAGHAYENPDVPSEIVLFPVGEAYVPLTNLRGWRERAMTAENALKHKNHG